MVRKPSSERTQQPCSGWLTRFATTHRRETPTRIGEHLNSLRMHRPLGPRDYAEVLRCDFAEGTSAAWHSAHDAGVGPAVRRWDRRESASVSSTSAASGRLGPPFEGNLAVTHPKTLVRKEASSCAAEVTRLETSMLAKLF